MENLLCNEVFDLTSPIAKDTFTTFDHDMHAKKYINLNDDNGLSFHEGKDENLEETFEIFLEKEKSYMPKEGFVKYQNSNEFVKSSRFKSVCWLIKAQRRFKLSLETVFNAVNYLDRFIAVHQCEEWKPWVFELLSIACLSAASKFNEKTPSLFELLMEGLGTVFNPSFIQQMEKTILETLEWRLCSVTPFVYVEMLVPNAHYLSEPSEYMNQLLLNTLLDNKFLEFPPSIIALSAIKQIFGDLYTDNNAGLAYFADHMDVITKCQEMMGRQYKEAINNIETYCTDYYLTSSPSPVTILTEEEFELQDNKFQLRCSITKHHRKEAIQSTVKRKTTEEVQEGRPLKKRLTFQYTVKRKTTEEEVEEGRPLKKRLTLAAKTFITQSLNCAANVSIYSPQ